MSTENLDAHFFPDAEALEKLANQFFQAIPGSQLPADIPSADAYKAKAWNEQAGRKSDLSQPDLDHGFKSVAGSGISPSIHPHDTTFNVSDPQTSLPDPHFAGSGKIPKSVAGSGVSPSAAQREKVFDVKDPQTSLPDPHFENKNPRPASASGFGASPSSLQQSANAGGYTSYLEQAQSPVQKYLPESGSRHDEFSAYPPPDNFPFIPELPFSSELKSILNSIPVQLPSAQLPFLSNPSFSEATFYFLSGKDQLPFVKEVRVLNSGDDKNGAGSSVPFDANLFKRDFPILQERVHGHPLIWLDNAATTQKPKQVIDRVSYFYEHENSNIHRAAHELAARATDAYEAARKKVQGFLNAASPNEIIFVRGATEAINLVAQSWGDQQLKEGDEIIVSHLEHHANIVPWQQLALRKGLRLKVIPVDDDGQILLDEYGKLLGPKTRLVSFTQVSNALGTVTPARQMVEMAHAAGARVLVDGAQAVSHMRADVTALNCDWYVFSGHKVFGPTGIGVLYGKEYLLNETQPWQGGGNMIVDVTFEKTKFQSAPGRFEAGTGNIADAVGLGAAIDYVSRIGIHLIQQYEHYLLEYATRLLKTIPGLRLIGTAADKAGVLSFVLAGYKTEEVGLALNQRGIAVRSGHHCAQPILRRFGVETTVRPSLALYNSCADIDALIHTLQYLATRKK